MRRQTRVILLSAQGRPFTQAMARELAKVERVVLICGRYEGVDERINELYCDMELSIGDYVLSGGELAAAVVVDTVMRLVPGVLGNEASGEFESFGVADAEISSDEEGVPRSQHGAGGLLDYPHYTRPAEFGGMRAPEVLMNGDHLQIRKWRREQQLRKTLKNRPDLLERAELSEEDRRILDAIRRRTKSETNWTRCKLRRGSSLAFAGSRGLWRSSSHGNRLQGEEEGGARPASRWGILLVMLGYACIWAFVRPVGFEKSAASLIASMVLGPPSVVLVWMAARHLDKQWRFEAALSEDHKLITTGPYRWLRNPIYASMFGMLLATGFAKTWWPLLVAA